MNYSAIGSCFTNEIKNKLKADKAFISTERFIFRNNNKNIKR